jgi:hypothetical protein
MAAVGKKFFMGDVLLKRGVVMQKGVRSVGNPAVVARLAYAPVYQDGSY